MSGDSSPPGVDGEFLHLNSFLQLHRGGRSIFLNLLGLDGVQFKIFCMSKCHTLRQPALGPYAAFTKHSLCQIPCK